MRTVLSRAGTNSSTWCVRVLEKRSAIVRANSFPIVARSGAQPTSGDQRSRFREILDAISDSHIAIVRPVDQNRNDAGGQRRIHVPIRIANKVRCAQVDTEFVYRGQQ